VNEKATRIISSAGAEVVDDLDEVAKRVASASSAS
jgi:hypothetical protein